MIWEENEKASIKLDIHNVSGSVIICLYSSKVSHNHKSPDSKDIVSVALTYVCSTVAGSSR